MSYQDESIKGVAVRHAKAIAGVAKDFNCFIFIRPSTDDTVRLIEEGMATKSNDVHDKSSDWGPMAGFVPVDQGLNKKSNSPDRNNAKVKIGAKGGGTSSQVHLALTSRLVGQMVAAQKMLPTIIGPKLGGYQRFYYEKLGTRRNFARDRATGKVYWIDDDGTLVPIVVWAYNGTPITGDYDLWLVAPHVTLGNTPSSKRQLDELIRIYKTIDEHDTTSAASPFLVDLNTRLNRACFNAIPGSKQVFNHGAEAQNYGFTQTIDADPIAMFTPTGGFRGVSPNRVHYVLDDMERKGYLVIRNKKWDQINPALGGQGQYTRGRHLWGYVTRAVSVADAKTGRRTDEQAERRRAVLDRHRQSEDVAPWAHGSNPIDPKLAGKYGLGEKDIAERRALGEFGRNLREARAETVHKLRELKPADFPSASRLDAQRLAQLRRIADLATNAATGEGYTVDDGKGNIDLTRLGDRPNAFATGLKRARKVPSAHH